MEAPVCITVFSCQSLSSYSTLITDRLLRLSRFLKWLEQAYDKLAVPQHSVHLPSLKYFYLIPQE